MDEAHRQYHEVANIFPLMKDADFEALKADIAEHGLHEPIWLHPDGSIIDGRNRHRACIELGIAPKFRTYQGDSPVAFAISVNVKRRMLTADQKMVIAVRILPMLEDEARQRQIAAGAAGAAGAEFGKLGGRGNKNPLVARVPQGGFDDKPEKEREPLSRDIAGAAVGVSGRKVADAKMIAEKAPDLFDQVTDGAITGAEAKRELKKRDAEAQKQEILAKYEQVDVWAGTLNLNTFAVADIGKLDLPQESIDMIFTDPPYHDEYIDLYERLAAVAASALKPGGYCLAYAGKMFIPQIIERMVRHLEYVSVFAVFQPFSQARIQKHNLFENWRPILAFKRPGQTATRAWTQDVVRGSRDKSHHEWQQDIEAPLQYIEAYTKPGDVVLDPFCGGGTTIVACRQLGRFFVAFDANEEAVKLSTDRVSNASNKTCVPQPGQAANTAIPRMDAPEFA